MSQWGWDGEGNGPCRVDEDSEACQKACSRPVVEPGTGPQQPTPSPCSNSLLQGRVPPVGGVPSGQSRVTDASSFGLT